MTGMCRIILMLFAILLAGCGGTPPLPARHVLTYASPYPATHPFSLADRAWMAWMERRSGGEIGFKTYWSGALLSSEMSIHELRRGVVDIALISPIYARGGTHLLRAQSGFYVGVDSIADQVRLYHCAAAHFPAFEDELHGLKVLAVQGGNFPGIITRERRIRKLADLKGLRLRAPTEAVPVLERLGADPVNLPMGEVYSAMAKGVIDGVVAPADTLKAMHFAEVGAHFSSIRFSRGGYPARAISDRAWNRLPVHLQRILREGAAEWEARLQEELLKAEEAGLAYGAAEGVSSTPFPAGDQARFDAVYRREVAREAASLRNIGIDAMPIYAAIQQWIRQSGTGCEPTPAASAQPTYSRHARAR
jgi:TRAP-type C4-dicarboxylate transport system substrate-binding protein